MPFLKGIPKYNCDESISFTLNAVMLHTKSSSQQELELLSESGKLTAQIWM